jgi:two-component system response regulator YesN
MRVVIADDEPLVRSYLRSLIAEALPGEATVLEAADGRELAELASRGKADVAFVDIRMPKMDGFAAMASLDTAGRKIPWFVLSSYSDFAYAKRALELGASGYALKPPSPEEIKSALSVLRAAVEAERTKKSDRFDRDWALFVSGDADAVPNLGPGAVYSVGLVVLDGETGTERRMKRAKTVARMLQVRARRYAASGLCCAAYPWGPSGDVALIAGAVPADESVGPDAVLRRFRNEAALAAETGDEQSVRVRAIALYADAGPDASRCGQLLAVLRDTAKRRALLPSGAVDLSQAEALLASCPSADVELALRASELVRCLRGGDLVGLKETIADYLAAEADRRVTERFLECYLGASAASRKDADLFAACAARFGFSAEKAKERDTIAAVEDYLRRRYAERIGVEQAAAVFGLTPNYLSSLFHKRVGVTFVRYLTEIRLLKARESLRDGKSVKETAWAVGYGSERHFARLYRERFGYAPATEKHNAKKS